MKVNMYAIHDRKLNIFHAPVLALNDEDAKRKMAQAFASPQSPYFDYYEDYSLNQIGTFDDSGGLVATVKTKQIAIGDELAEMAALLKNRRELGHAYK